MSVEPGVAANCEPDDPEHRLHESARDQPARHPSGPSTLGSWRGRANAVGQSQQVARTRWGRQPTAVTVWRKRSRFGKGAHVRVALCRVPVARVLPARELPIADAA
jgi:hypothetical protein